MLPPIRLEIRVPRFHFNVEDGHSYPDRDGTEMPDIAAARVEAVRTFGELLGRSPETFWNGEEWRMEVTNDRGLVLFCLHFVGMDAPALKAWDKQPVAPPLTG